MQKLDEGEELGVGEELGAGVGLGVGVGLELGVGAELALALAAEHLQLEGNWSRTRSHLPSSNDSRCHRHKSLCTAWSHPRPRRESLWHIDWWCGP